MRIKATGSTDELPMGHDLEWKPSTVLLQISMGRSTKLVLPIVSDQEMFREGFSLLFNAAETSIDLLRKYTGGLML